MNFLPACSRRTNPVRLAPWARLLPAVLRDLIDSGRVLVVGAMYDLASGRVTMLPR